MKQTTRRFAGPLALALALAAGLATGRAEPQFGGGGGIAWFDGRRCAVTCQPSDLPAVQQFAIGTGHGSTVTFVLPAGVDPARLSVKVGGVAQDGSFFAVTAGSITFTAPPPQGAPIFGAVGALPSAPPGSAVIYPPITAHGVAVSWLLSSTPISFTRYRVTIDGLGRPHGACSITSIALTCVVAPPADTVIVLDDGP